MDQAPVTITPYRDGPLLVRGPFQLCDQEGNPIAVDRAAPGGRRGRPPEVTALCRCGRSRIRPFCDGTHRLVKFRAPSTPEAEGLTPPE